MQPKRKKSLFFYVKKKTNSIMKVYLKNCIEIPENTHGLKKSITRAQRKESIQ